MNTWKEERNAASPGGTPTSASAGVQRRRHPLVVATEREILSKQPNVYGLSYGWGPTSLSVKVSRASMRRALSIFDNLIRRVEKAGGKVCISRDQPPKTLVRLEGIELKVKIYELATRADHILTKTQQADIRKGHSWGIPKWDFTPSGELVFEIEEYLGENVQRTWTDGKRRKLSDQPDRFFEKFKKAVEARKAQEAKWKREQREAHERFLRQEEERKRQEKEQRRRENMKALAENWELANRIRGFVAAAREALLVHHGVLEDGSALANWLDDAAQVAERLDPIPDAFSKLSPRRVEDTRATPPSSPPPLSPP